MKNRFHSGLILLIGLAFLATALALQMILLELRWTTWFFVILGGFLTVWAGWNLKAELMSLMRHRKGEIALYTLGIVGVLVSIGYYTARYSWQFDLTESGVYSLSDQTVALLQRLEKPVHIVLFHDPLMRRTVDLYERIAIESDLVTVEFYDPTLNPAQARLMGVQFAGTSIMESETRRFRVHGESETEIVNGILRVAQAVKHLLCFLEGHSEADPFSMESHDHVEGADGHSHGLGERYVLHERHGLAKARHGLETLNYTVETRSLAFGRDTLTACALLIVAGPKTALLAVEIEAISTYLSAGGNALFMLDPFVYTGLDPLLRNYGIVLNESIVIDPSSHYWTDASAPAVTIYNRHQITRNLPLTFFPGVRSLSPTNHRVPGMAVMPIVNSTKASYVKSQADRADFDSSQDKLGPATLMVVVNRRPVSSDIAPSRLVVVGDSDFATNSFFHILGNGTLFLNTVNYLVAQENLIGVQPRTYDLPRLSMTNQQMKGVFVLSVVLLPATLMLLGIVVWWKKR